MIRFAFAAFLAIASLSATSVTANAAAFDCNRVYGRPAEMMICSDEYLSGADDNMAVVYYGLYDFLNRPNARALAAEQRAWLQQRNACGANNECLQNWYLTRTAQLCGLATYLRAPVAAERCGDDM